MAKVPVFNLKGVQTGERELSDRFFAVPANALLIQQAVVAEQANARKVIAHTKTRADVRGGGKKPWKQKGTGRARHGSSRSPIWRGGGVTFGPRNDANYSVKINKKMRRKALLMALSDKVGAQRFLVMESLPEAGKTKDFSGVAKAILTAIKATRQPKTVVVVPTISDSLKRSTRNLKGFEAIRTDSLNIKTIIGAEYTLTTPEGVVAMEAWFAKRDKAEKTV
ncbi:MAG: 50S ribosomal protein L4 [Patescibacteria group bacterium]